MRKHLLSTGAATASTIAILSATPAPGIGHNRDILILAATAAAVLWIGLWMNCLADRIQNGVGETRTDVHEYREEVNEYARHTGVAKLLKAAGRPIDGEPLTLPTPQGSIRPIATEIDGDTILVGVDAATHLADIIDLQTAIADRDGEAAL
jgi:hypothetical protein